MRNIPSQNWFWDGLERGRDTKQLKEDRSVVVASQNLVPLVYKRYHLSFILKNLVTHEKQCCKKKQRPDILRLIHLTYL
jgi:hypothetical protein